MSPWLPSRFGAGARGGGAPGAGACLVLPLVQAPAPGVHEEVAHCAELQPQLLGDGDLQLFGWTLVLLEYRVQSSALDIGEDQPGLFGCVASILSVLLLFPLARCKGTQDSFRTSPRGHECEAGPATPPAFPALRASWLWPGAASSGSLGLSCKPWTN